MFSKTALCAAALLAAAGQVSAEGLYGGVKIGAMDLDYSGSDDATNLGALLGYDFPGRAQISGAVEGEVTTTIIDGEVGRNNDWSLDTLGVFGVMKIGDALYAKLKGGIVYEEGKVEGRGGSVDGDDTNLSFGFGGGWRVQPNVALEIEFTRIEEDVDFWSFGANFYF
jgi:hypothetical protein